MSAATLPSPTQVCLFIIALFVVCLAILLWQRFAPGTRQLRRLLKTLSPALARLIAADFAEQVLGAGETGPAMELNRLGLATARAFAVGRASGDELQGVRRALARAYGTEFIKVAGESRGGDHEPDLSDLARRLAGDGLIGDLPSDPVAVFAAERLRVAMTSGVAETFVVQAVAAACADRPKPMDAARCARGAWANQQEARVAASLVQGRGHTDPLAMPIQTAAPVPTRDGAELIPSQVDLARYFTKNGPAVLASLMNRGETTAGVVVAPVPALQADSSPSTLRYLGGSAWKENIAS